MLRHIHPVMVGFLCMIMTCAPIYAWALQLNYSGQKQTTVDVGNMTTHLQYNDLNNSAGQFSQAILGNHMVQTVSIYVPVTLTVAGQLTHETCPAGKLCAKQFGNGNIALYDYTYQAKINPNQQLDRVSFYHPTTTNHNQYQLLYQTTYQYNINAELTQKTRQASDQPAQATYHTYDALGRIVSSKISDKVTQYQYDANNNRCRILINGIANKEQINGIDQLMQYHQATLSYNNNGNMTTDGANAHYDFNARNQLVDAQNLTGIYQYRYTANGVRWQKSLNNAPTMLTYYYEGNQLLNTALIAHNLTTSMSHYLLSATRAGRVLTHSTQRYIDQNSIHYPLLTRNHSITGNFDTTGQLTITQHYSDYGVPATGHPSQPTMRNLQNSPMGYDGEQYDPETKLSYLRARYYDPTLGRFISQDSYRLINRYVFAQGDPINRTDPNGHQSFLQGFESVAIPVALLFAAYSISFGLTYAGYAAYSWWYATDETLEAPVIANELENAISPAEQPETSQTETMTTPKNSDASSNSSYAEDIHSNTNTRSMSPRTGSDDSIIDEDSATPEFAKKDSFYAVIQNDGDQQTLNLEFDGREDFETRKDTLVDANHLLHEHRTSTVDLTNETNQMLERLEPLQNSTIKSRSADSDETKQVNFSDVHTAFTQLI